MMAYKFLKNHPRVNVNKIGITGSSRGGTVSFIVADKKFTENFLDSGDGFAAILPMSPECRIAGLFENPEITKNSKILVVQGKKDEIKSCIEYVEKIKANGGDIKIDLKKGWHHDFVGHRKAFKDYRYNFSKCPPYYIKDNGDINDKMMKFLVGKKKAWKSKKRYYEDAARKPARTLKKVVKKLKKSKCVTVKGLYSGGKHGKEFTPQFLGFFNENLL